MRSKIQYVHDILINLSVLTEQKKKDFGNVRTRCEIPYTRYRFIGLCHRLGSMSPSFKAPNHEMNPYWPFSVLLNDEEFNSNMNSECWFHFILCCLPWQRLIGQPHRQGSQPIFFENTHTKCSPRLRFIFLHFKIKFFLIEYTVKCH